MKFYTFDDFVKLRPGVVFFRYEPHIYGPLSIKGETINDGTDFFCHEMPEWDIEDVWEYGRNALLKLEPEIDLEIQGREALYDKTMLYAVLSSDDIRTLIQKLHACLAKTEEEGL